jgi:Pathogenicity locus
VSTSVAPARDWAARRRTVPKKVVDDLSRIPGVGPSLAADLFLVGIREVAELRGGDPEKLYRELCTQVGSKVDRCVLYVFRCAVYYASEDRHDPEKLKWWNWKE